MPETFEQRAQALTDTMLDDIVAAMERHRAAQEQIHIEAARSIEADKALDLYLDHVGTRLDSKPPLAERLRRVTANDVRDLAKRRAASRVKVAS